MRCATPDPRSHLAHIRSSPPDAAITPPAVADPRLILMRVNSPAMRKSAEPRWEYRLLWRYGALLLVGVDLR
jgi:hypothetical protein